MDQSARNYSTISPSAKALLLMKGLTNIPFARQAAELISRPEQYVPDYSNRNLGFWARVTHFESRYQSIDQLLSGLAVKNILELSSGFSLRGLAAIEKSDVYYIDTDLPEVIAQKKEFVQEIQQADKPTKGVLELLPLNALDEVQFKATVAHFPEGPLAIVNEGLLMYLGIAEKKKLCAQIHESLQERGGYWITADVYIRNDQMQASMKFDDELQKFLDQHDIEKNKFNSLEEAEAFFDEAGFVVDKEAEPDYSIMSSIPYFMQCVTPEQIAEMGKIGRIQTTWRLKLK